MSYKIQPPVVEWIWSHNWMKTLMASVYFVSPPLAFLTLLCKVLSIPLHCGTVISLVQSHLPQFSPTRVSYWFAINLISRNTYHPSPLENSLEQFLIHHFKPCHIVLKFFSLHTLSRKYTLQKVSQIWILPIFFK